MDVCLGAEHRYDNLPPHPGPAQRKIACARDGRAPVACSWVNPYTTLVLRSLTFNLAQAGAGSPDTQLGHIAEAPLEGRIAEGIP